MPGDRHESPLPLLRRAINPAGAQGSGSMQGPALSALIHSFLSFQALSKAAALSWLSLPSIYVGGKLKRNEMHLRECLEELPCHPGIVNGLLLGSCDYQLFIEP